MDDVKHTPGPWGVGSRHTSGGVYTESGDLIANTHGAQRNFKRDEQIAEQDANARLIAAAPDLLAALRKTVAQLEKVHDDAFNQAIGHGLCTTDGRAFSCMELNRCSDVAKEALAAIAKATGGA